MRLLLVEDDAMIGKAVRQGLSAAGYAVDWVTDGRSAELAFANGVYDLAVLDLGLPRQDGLVVLKGLRSRGDTTPVLVATARDAVSDRIAGLDAGADDYVVKPFDLDELLARLRSLMRRSAGSATAVVTRGRLSLDPVRKQVMLSSVPVELSPKEYSIIEALMQRPGAVLSRERLEASVYSWDEQIGSNAIEVHLHNLRKKLGSETIRNVRGVGYRLAEE